MVHVFDDGLTALLVQATAHGPQSAHATAVFRKSDNRLLYSLTHQDRPANWLQMDNGYGWLGVRNRPEDMLILGVGRLASEFYCLVLEASETGFTKVGCHRRVPEMFRVPQMENLVQAYLPGLNDPTPETYHRRAEDAHQAHLRSMQELREREERFEHWRQVYLLRHKKEPAPPRLPINPVNITTESLRFELEGIEERITMLHPRLWGRRATVEQELILEAVSSLVEDACGDELAAALNINQVKEEIEIEELETVQVPA